MAMFPFRWQYFGSRNGVLRVSPRLERSSDVLSTEYDPREQSWYTGSSMMAVNAVIILDTSTSMNGSRYVTQSQGQELYGRGIIVWDLGGLGPLAPKKLPQNNIEIGL